MDHTGEVGIGATLAGAKLDVRGTVYVGTNGTGHDVSFHGDESGRRLFWNESKMALRAGIDADEGWWSDEYTGRYSVAFGENIRAGGKASLAARVYAEAAGDWSVAFGELARAYGDASIAIGYGVSAWDPHSVAIGDYVYADDGGIAIGSYVSATADNSIVIGRGTDIDTDLENNVPNSLVVGFGGTESALFVGGSNNYVGIGTDEPLRRCHIRDVGIDLPASALYADMAVVEDTDAILGRLLRIDVQVVVWCAGAVKPGWHLCCRTPRAALGCPQSRYLNPGAPMPL